MKTTRWLAIAMIVTVLTGCDSGDGDGPPLEIVVIDSYEIPLDALVGSYAHDDPPQDTPPRSRMVTFRIPDDVEDFRELRLVASGTGEQGRVIRTFHAGGYTLHDTIPVVARLDLGLAPDTDPDRCIHASATLRGGEFAGDDLVTECGEWSSVEAAGLLGRDIQATLSCNMPLGEDDQIFEPAGGEVAEIRLEAIEVSVWRESDGMGWPYEIRPDP